MSPLCANVQPQRDLKKQNCMELAEELWAFYCCGCLIALGAFQGPMKANNPAVDTKTSEMWYMHAVLDTYGVRQTADQ